MYLGILSASLLVSLAILFSNVYFVFCQSFIVLYFIVIETSPVTSVSKSFSCLTSFHLMMCNLTLAQGRILPQICEDDPAICCDSSLLRACCCLTFVLL